MSGGNFMLDSGYVRERIADRIVQIVINWVLVLLRYWMLSLKMIDTCNQIVVIVFDSSHFISAPELTTCWMHQTCISIGIGIPNPGIPNRNLKKREDSLAPHTVYWTPPEQGKKTCHCKKKVRTCCFNITIMYYLVRTKVRLCRCVDTLFKRSRSKVPHKFCICVFVEDWWGLK